MLYKHGTNAPPGPWKGFIKTLKLRTHVFVLHVWCLCPLVSTGSVGSHAVHFVFHGPKLLYWSLSVHFVPVCSIFLELVALDYQPLGLSPVPGWWRVEDGIVCTKEDCLQVPPASSNVNRVGNGSRKEEMCSEGTLHPRVMVERSRGRECHIFIVLSLRGFLS